MSKILKFEYFRVELPEGSDKSFEAVLQDVITEDVKKRHFRSGLGHSVIRLQDLEKWSTGFVGDMLKIRMENLPSKASMEGPVGPLPLEADEGVGEGTAFFYDTKTKVLILQKNRQYCSHFAFGNYFGEMGDLDGPLLLVPALRPDVYQKFNEFNRIYHMDVRVAGLESARKLVGEGHGVATLLGLMNNLQSPTLKVEFGVGRGGGTMSASTAKTYLRRILRWLSKEEHFVEKLKVRGSPNLDTPPEVLDLIKDRLVDDVEVDMDEDRRISFQKRGNALKELWRKRRKDLVQLFEAP